MAISRLLTLGNTKRDQNKLGQEDALSLLSACICSGRLTAEKTQEKDWQLYKAYFET